MVFPISRDVYDPAARLDRGDCSIYEMGGACCLGLLAMPTDTCERKVACIAGCTVIGTFFGTVGGALVGGVGAGPGAGIGAASGFTTGVIKVAIDAYKRHKQQQQQRQQQPSE